MKPTLLISAVVFSILSGCQTTPPPSPGLATLRVILSAEAKTGVVTGNTHVRAYDAGPAKTIGAFEKVDYTSLDDIVVWIEPVSGNGHSPTTESIDKLRMLQVNPININIDSAKHADSLAAVVGPMQLIIFHNAGSSPVNLYSVSDGNDFDLGEIPARSTASYGVKSPGLIEVLTDSMTDPVSLIFVAPSMDCRRARAGETIEFTNLAPGNYKVVSWHPRLPGQTIMTTLSPDQITTASIKVGVNDLPKIQNR